MSKFIKIMSILSCFFLVFTTAACGKDDNEDKAETCTVTLDDVNKLINGMNMSSANHIQIIPFNHVNGPKIEWKFYALVNFESDMYTHVKYQVTFISCTCRDQTVNYWSTAYMELTRPESYDAADVVLKTLSFDKDIQDEDLEPGQHNYTAGFWGDSDPIAYNKVPYDVDGDGEIENGEEIYDVEATYDRVENPYEPGTYYPSIKHDFIPKLVGKTHAEIDEWTYYTDMNDPDLSVFSGASVSTNNIIRIVQATMDYHVSRYLS